MSNLDATIVAVAFPTMIAYFKTSLVLAGWILSVYTLVFIAAIPIASKLSDSGRRKQTLIICLILFTIGSALCALAPSIGLLALFRVMQALGGGGFFSAATGLISDELPERRLQFIGLLMSIGQIGSVVGPNLGGVLVQYWGWKSIFWVNVPIGVIALFACQYLVKPDKVGKNRIELDFLGIGLIIGFVSAIMVATTLLGNTFHIPIFVIVLIALLGIVFLVMFVSHCRNTPNAIVSRELLLRKEFLAGNLFNFLWGTSNQIGIISLMPLYATSVYGVSVVESGIIMTPRSIGIIISSTLASFFIMKWGYRRPLIIGTLGIMLGLLVMALEPGKIVMAGISLNPVMLLTIIGLFIGIASGLSAPASNNACIDLMPEKTASITGMRQMVIRIGSVISISVSTLILQSSKDMAHGFMLVFGGFGLLLLLAIPFVFLMPAKPKANI
jgi:MFS family permease